MGSTTRLAERFWAKVDKSGDCWNWTAARGTGGYGKILVDGKACSTHRIVYELMVGPIPKGAGFHGTCVLHRCDNRLCVNPAHLFLGTQLVNVRDMAAKGRRVNPESLKTHCPAGHPFDTANTYRWRGQRGCKTCRAARIAEWNKSLSEKRRIMRGVAA